MQKNKKKFYAQLYCMDVERSLTLVVRQCGAAVAVRQSHLNPSPPIYRPLNWFNNLSPGDQYLYIKHGIGNNHQ